MAERIVLDAHAMLAFLGDEPGAQEVGQILSTGEPWMTLVALGEVAYILERSAGAASIKARGGLSYADAFAVAAAAVLDCPILTGDPEFRVAEQTGVTVRWLARRP